MNLRPLTLGPESAISRTYWEYRHAQINRMLDNAATPEAKLRLLEALHRSSESERTDFDKRRVIKPVSSSVQTPKLQTSSEIRAHSLQITHLHMTVERGLLEMGETAKLNAPETAIKTGSPLPQDTKPQTNSLLARVPWKEIGQTGLSAAIGTARLAAQTARTLYLASAPLRRMTDRLLVTVSKFAIDQAAKAIGEIDWIIQQEIIYPLFRRSFNNSARIANMADQAKQKPKLAVASAFAAVAVPILLTTHTMSEPKPASDEPIEALLATVPANTALFAKPNINTKTYDVSEAQTEKKKHNLSQKHKLAPKQIKTPRPTYDYALAAAPDRNVAPPARGKWDWDALLYNSKYEGLLLDAAEKMLGKRPSDVFQGIVMTESGGRQHGPDGQTIRSPKNAIGIAQVLPSTGKYIAPKCFGEKIDWGRFYNDKDYNYEAGRCYFEEQHDQFGNPILGALAYNGGPKGLEWRMQAYGKPVQNTPEGMVDFMRSIKNPENRHYVPATMVKLGLISVDDLGPDVYTRATAKIRSPK